MYKIGIVEFEGSLAAIFPDDLLSALQVGEGDSLFVSETEDGFLITRDDPEFDEAHDDLSSCSRAVPERDA